MDENKKRMQPYFITLIYAFYYIAYTSLFSFLTMYLTSYGYEGAILGFIYSATSFIFFVAQPLLGYIADSLIPIKKLVIVAMIISVPAGFLLPLSVRILPLMIFSVLFLALLDQSLMSLIDSWTYMAKAGNDYIIYSRARGMGSLTSAIIAVIVGFSMTSFGPDIIIIYHGIAMAIAVIFAVLFMNVPCRNKATTAQTEKTMSLKQAFFTLSKNKKYMYLLIGLLLICIGYRAIITYLPVMIKTLGGNSSHQGLAVTMLTIAIYPIMFIYPKLIKRFNIAKMLIAGVITVVIRTFTMAIVRDLNVLIYMQLLEAIAFGLFNPSIIEYVSRITPLQIRSSAITISAATQIAISGIIGNLIASWFLAYSNLYLMYGVFTVLGVLGFGCILLSIRTKSEMAEKKEP